MLIGIPKEVKSDENRVSCTPAGALSLISAGHKVIIETNAGIGSGFTDEEYQNAGAKVVKTAEDAWKAEMVIKVKEPIKTEYKFLREDLILFTFLHLAADKDLTDALVNAGTQAIAYETVEAKGKLVLLEPMSEIAGRMSSLVGAYFLGSARGGSGILPTGVPGVLPANILVIGGGTAGFNAAKVAAGFGANVTILELNNERMKYLEDVLPQNVRTLFSNENNLFERLQHQDLIIGAVLLPGAKAPKLITREMLKEIRPKSVFVDIAIDQGGCAETSRGTTHESPVYFEEDILHYCVTNMPGAYARTSTNALTNVTFPYALKIANNGFKESVKKFPDLKKGVNTYQGKITCEAVAQAFDMNFEPLNF